MIKYSSRVATFDIETTTFYDFESKQKKAFVYSLAMNIDGQTHVWRKIEDWIKFIKNIETNDEVLVIYVHNLGYEFSFLHKYLNENFNIKKLCCANNPNKPIFVRLFENGGHNIIIGKPIEFRCSFMLSGMSLAKTTEGQESSKMVGDLDYSKIRHYSTPLTNRELGYIKADVESLAEYIAGMYKKFGVNNLPYTSTGFVRNECRKACFKNKAYHKYIRDLKMNTQVAKLMIEGFSGGYTHANYRYADTIVKNVKSYDITSDYPARMLLDYYPVSDFRETDPELFDMYSETHCCIGVFRFEGIVENGFGCPAISESKCRVVNGIETDNGRIRYADVIELTCTEVDIESFKLMYTWSEMKCLELHTADRGTLPTELLTTMYDFYLAKTELKDVSGMEEEYMYKKALLNSFYGMMVTGLIRPEYIYDCELGELYVSNEHSPEELIEKAQKDKKRFLYFPWGVWITAHARHELFRMIVKSNGKFVYSDTDSIKVIYTEEFEEEIKKRNKELAIEVEIACAKLGITNTRPKTVKGKEKMISLWDDDGLYTYFKTLGAKRYLCYNKHGAKNHKFTLTCSGVDKKKGLKWLREHGKTIKGTFDMFRNGITIDAEHSGKTVVRRSMCGEKELHDITDYKGDTATVEVWTYSTIEDAPYNLKLGEEYEELLKNYIGD